MLKFWLGCAMLLNGIATARADINLRPTTAPTPQQVQWTVDVDRHYDNPFDPDQILIDAHLSGPNGASFSVPAYWEGGSDGNDGHFAVRFSPPTVGKWTVDVTATDQQGSRSAAPLEFDVASVSARGFVRRSPVNSAYFRFDNGDSFFPVGINMAWGEEKRFSSYEKWLPDFAAAGGNFARVWMCDPSVMTESAATGLGRYDPNACDFYDRVLSLAQKNNVYCIITFNNYRDLRESDNWGPCPWKLLPYCSENGGPATRPVDFIRDPRCQKLYRQRLRYIAGRYGSFNSVGVWEFFNEQTFSDVPIPASWTIDMARYLRSVDPAAHLISTSYGGAAQDEVWRNDLIGLTQTHYYGDEHTADCTPAVRGSVAMQRTFAKPYLMAEIGISAMDSDQKYDSAATGTNLHNGLWAALASGAAGTTMNWWWDSYVGADHLWSEYSGIAAFSAALDLSNSHYAPVDIDTPLHSTAANEPETFSDSVLPAAGGYGKSHGRLVTLRPNGLADHPVAHYLFGLQHQEMISPTQIDAVFAAGAEVVIHVSKVSDAGVLRVLIDKEPAKDFLLSALPGAANIKSTTRATRDESEAAPRIYQADVNLDCAVPVPAGKHRIELRNLGNDWLTIDSVTLRKTRSSRYATLDVLAMVDPKTQSAVAWLHDPQSNWRNDLDGKRVVPIDSAGFAIPINVECDVQWWDTRSGKIISKSKVSPENGMLAIRTPTITRDIALIARPTQH